MLQAAVETSHKPRVPCMPAFVLQAVGAGASGCSREPAAGAVGLPARRRQLWAPWLQAEGAAGPAVQGLCSASQVRLRADSTDSRGTAVQCLKSLPVDVHSQTYRSLLWRWRSLEQLVPGVAKAWCCRGLLADPVQPCKLGLEQVVGARQLVMCGRNHCNHPKKALAHATAPQALPLQLALVPAGGSMPPCSVCS